MPGRNQQLVLGALARSERVTGKNRDGHLLGTLRGIVDTDEEIFEMNNGCICCMVRGDLIHIIESLMRRRDRFDAILIETTGLTPRPSPRPSLLTTM